MKIQKKRAGLPLLMNEGLSSPIFYLILGDRKMNVYRVCLMVEKDIFHKTDIYLEEHKYLWIVSTDLLSVIPHLENLLKIDYKDYYFEDIQLMGEARIV